MIKVLTNPLINSAISWHSHAASQLIAMFISGLVNLNHTCK